MSNAGLLLMPIIEVDGRRLPDLDDLIEIRVDLAHNATATCALRFIDLGFERAGAAKLGAAIKVSVPNSGGVIFEGELTAIDVEVREGEQPELVMNALDLSHRLARTTVTHSYVKTDLGSVIKDLATKAGLSASVAGIGGTKRQYHLQADNALALIDQAAARYGASWWMEGKTLHVAKGLSPRGSVTRTLQETLSAISVHAAGMAPDELTVRDWQPGAKPIESVIRAEAATGSTLSRAAAGGAKAYGGKAKRVAAIDATDDLEDAKALGTALLERLRATAVTVRGTCTTDAKLVPGGTLSVKDAGPLDGTYPLSRVLHLVRPSTGLTTRFECGSFDRPGLAGLLSSAPRPAAAIGGHHELLFATVTNLNDPEELGRVRVKFPGLTDEDESAWARVASMGAGKERGALFLPEVDDDVVIGFERGDLRRPVVLGGIFSGTSKQPIKSTDGKVVQSRRLQSRLKHYIEFGDGTSSSTQHIVVALDGAKHRLRIGKDEIILEGPGTEPMTIKNGGQASIVLNNNKVTIKGTDIVLQATNGLSMEGVTVKADAKGQMALSSKGTLDVKASGMGAIDGGGMLTLKGGMVQIN